MQGHSHAAIVNAQQLYKSLQYQECIDFLNTHLSDLGEDRSALSIALCLQAQSYYRLGNYEEGMVSALESIETDSKNADAYNWLGNLYREIGFYNMAEGAYKKAISLMQNQEYYYLNLASVYKLQNKYNEALINYKKILEINPKNTKAYRNMSVCFKYDSLYHEHHERILEILSHPAISDEEKMECYFVLAKIHQDCDCHAQAFSYIQEANALRTKIFPFDSIKHKIKIDTIISNFRKRSEGSNKQIKADGENLIFLIGIPRAGKSLIEKILVESKGAIGLGEIALFERILRKAKQKLDQKLQENIDINQIDQDISNYIKDEYLKEIKRRSFADNRLIVDSTPSNYQHVGLIVKLFPSAKLIYCHRDPLDHILQVYFKYFAEGNGYSYDLLKLTHFYVDYCRLITFWKRNMVTQMIEVNYEDLIKAPKDTIVKICRFVDVSVPHPLPKLYHREIGLWRHYSLYFEMVKMILKKNGFQGM